MPLPGLIGGVSLLSGLFKGFGTYGASKEQQASLKANARVARIRGVQQERAIQAQADIQTEVGREELSTIRNTFANRGIDITSGSPLLAATSAYADQLADRNEMFRQGEIARITGENQAQQMEYKADQLKSALPLQLLGIGISTATSATSNFMNAGGDFSFLKSGNSPSRDNVGGLLGSLANN